MSARNRWGIAALLVVAVALGYWAVGERVWGGLEFVPALLFPWLSKGACWKSWVGFLSRRESATPIALFRIGLGACVVSILGGMLYEDLVTTLWVDAEFGGVRKIPGTMLVNWLGGPSPDVVVPLVWATIFAAGLLMIGIGGRVIPFMVLQGMMALTDLHSQAGGSYDDLLENGLWILVLAPSTATLSLDAKIRTGRWVDPTPQLAWTRYLVIFQLILCYSTTGWQKLSVHWVPGGEFSALYYIFQQPTWQRFDMTWVAWIYPITQLATAITWFWEVLAPLWLLAFYYRLTRLKGGFLRNSFNALDVRLGFAVVGLMMHLVLLIFMNVGPFSPLTLSFYACLFDPEEYDALVRWFKRKLGRSTAPSATPAG